MKGAKIQIRDRNTGKLVMDAVTNDRGTVYQMIPIGPALSVCITANINGRSYFSYQSHLPRLTKFTSPSLHNAFLCPTPPPGYGRAILSWTYPRRQKLDLFTEYHNYRDRDDKSSEITTVWANNSVDKLAELDVPGGTHGIAPVSVLVKLEPHTEFRFHVRQYGTFDPKLCQGTETKSLELTDTTFRFYDEHGLVTTQSAKERLNPDTEMDEKCYIWNNVFIVRVEQSNILSLDENDFVKTDAESSALANLGVSQNGRIATSEERRKQLARESTLKLFRLIDPTVVTQYISCKSFVRAVMLQRSVQDFIASRPGISLFDKHPPSNEEDTDVLGHRW